MSDNTLIVITGPTGSGKTELSIQLAERLGCDIISADSRQIYRGLPIGTASPTASQLTRVKHHFVGVLELNEYYNAAQYESDVLNLLPQLWEKNKVQIMCGGSMMYIDAVCNGIDDIPTISDEIRNRVLDIYNQKGLDEIRRLLYQYDPSAADRVDIKNPRRNLHALEVCLQAGKPYTSLLTGEKKKRDFAIKKYYIDIPRDELFARINSRVNDMIEEGLIDEARGVYHLRGLNSLNTVGYKEMFAYFNGTMDIETAVSRLAKNTRVYAKKQMTWLKRAGDAIPIKSIDDILLQI